LKKNIIFTVLVCVAVVVAVMAGFMYRLSQPRMLTDHELREYGAMMLETPRRFSDFKFTDHRGEPFTREQLNGRWTLVFFGFTHCPDICPTTLATLNKVVAAMTEEERAALQVVMLSVDPERDTPDKLASYVPFFNADFIGLTGDQAQLLNLATQLGAVYTKVPLKGGDYTVDHSGNIVLINPMGDYHGLFRPPFEEGSVRVALRSIMTGFRH